MDVVLVVNNGDQNEVVDISTLTSDDESDDEEDGLQGDGWMNWCKQESVVDDGITIMIDSRTYLLLYHPISIKKEEFCYYCLFIGEIYLMVKEKYLLTTQIKKQRNQGGKITTN